MMACIRNDKDHQDFDLNQREHTLLSVLLIRMASVQNPRKSR